MSKPRTATLTFPVSSPKWRACCAREGISCTPISAATWISPSGRQRWPTPRCGAFGEGHQCGGSARDWRRIAPRYLDLIGRHLPAFLRPFGRAICRCARLADVPRTATRADFRTGCTASARIEPASVAHRRASLGAFRDDRRRRALCDLRSAISASRLRQRRYLPWVRFTGTTSAPRFSDDRPKNRTG